MKMNMFGTFLVSIAVALVSADAATPAYPACNSLDLVSVDYQTLIEYSPFKVYRIIQPFYKCSKVVYIKPFGENAGIAIIIKRNSSFLVWLNQINGTTWDVIQCATGAQMFSRGIYNKFNSESASVCFVICDDDGIGYKGLTCLGKTRKDEADIQKFLDTSLNGVPGIINAQRGCYEPLHCNLS